MQAWSLSAVLDEYVPQTERSLGFRAQPANVISTLLLFFSPRHPFLRKYNFIPNRNATATFLSDAKLQHFAT
ncbi:hypothetical protein CRM22_010310 [Opisthorchis felineus]|uniref:Uncharacterized protein n=1 Tax=Opisthorchis felineus TaxID=147828 RepID=A0A4S2KZT8_OPIFE|nr:hypothetical protein CRM22_010310 [Opisthorchis felineus]